MSQGKIIGIVLSVITVLSIIGTAVYFLSQEKYRDALKDKAENCPV